MIILETGMGKISLYYYLEKYVDIILYFSLSLSYIRMVKEGVRGWVLPTPMFTLIYGRIVPISNWVPSFAGSYRGESVIDIPQYETGCAWKSVYV
jgi:hypothetical protein